jgi:ribosomal protein S27E
MSSHVLPELSSDVDSESQAAWSKRYDDSECAICTEDWKSGDHVVLTQPCSHVLHVKCLDRWAMKCFEEGTDAVSCPVCRQTVESMSHVRFNVKTYKKGTVLIKNAWNPTA